MVSILVNAMQGQLNWML